MEKYYKIGIFLRYCLAKFATRPTPGPSVGQALYSLTVASVYSVIRRLIVAYEVA